MKIFLLFDITEMKESRLMSLPTDQEGSIPRSSMGFSSSWWELFYGIYQGVVNLRLSSHMRLYEGLFEDLDETK